jgi:hypothetical protein
MRQIAALAMVFVASRPALAAQKLCVNPNGSGGCFAEIQQAIDSAGASATVTIASGTYSGNLRIGNGLKLTHLALHGAGAATTTINGTGMGPVISINGAEVTISGVTIQNGASGFGGGIFVEGSSGTPKKKPPAHPKVFGSLTVSQCIVTNNQAPPGDNEEGGGIYAEDAPVTVLGSSITNNQAAYGGAIGFSSQSFPKALTIMNTTIAVNSASTDGGALEIVGAKLVTIRDTTISGNTSGRAAGISLLFSELVSIADSTISNNSASNGVGAIDDEGTDVTLNNVTITGNDAGTGAESTTGGIQTASSQVVVDVSNTIIGDNSGPLYPDCNATLTSGDFNLITSVMGCTITGETVHNITGENPDLGPLQNNGGGTETQALLSGSPPLAPVILRQIPAKAIDACRLTSVA